MSNSLHSKYNELWLFDSLGAYRSCVVVPSLLVQLICWLHKRTVPWSISAILAKKKHCCTKLHLNIRVLSWPNEPKCNVQWINLNRFNPFQSRKTSQDAQSLNFKARSHSARKPSTRAHRSHSYHTQLPQKTLKMNPQAIRAWQSPRWVPVPGQLGQDVKLWDMSNKAKANQTWLVTGGCYHKSWCVGCDFGQRNGYIIYNRTEWANCAILPVAMTTLKAPIRAKSWQRVYNLS